MHSRERLGEVAIAFVGDDHAGTGLGDQEVAAGDAHVGLEEFLAQHGARLAHQSGHRVLARASGVIGFEKVCDLFAGLVDGRGDDVRWRLVGELDDVFTQVGLDDLVASVLEHRVEADLFRDHRLSLADRFRLCLAADVEDDVARFLGIAGEMHMAAGRLDG